MQIFQKLKKQMWQKENLIKKVLFLICCVFSINNANARLIFTTEDDGVNADVYHLDKDNTSVNFIDLNFGNDVENQIRLRYDKTLDKFFLNRPLDLDSNELANFLVENLNTVPECNALTKGRLYYDTNLGDLLFCNGTEFVSTSQGGVGIGTGTFIGLTVQEYDGLLNYNSFTGYKAAREICNDEFPGSHVCRTDEILSTIDLKDITTLFTNGTTAWILEGAPGYTSNSNDCNGLTNNSNSDYYGAFWEFSVSEGGKGWLAPCSVTKPMACCK